jgi:hypothetical protein
VSEGEHQVSTSHLVRTLTLVRASQTGSSPLAIWACSRQSREHAYKMKSTTGLSASTVSPIVSRSLPLLLFPPFSPLPTISISTWMARKKATAKELLARAETSSYRRGAHRKDLHARPWQAWGQDQKGPRCRIGPLRHVRDLSTLGTQSHNCQWIRITLVEEVEA